MSTFGNSPEGWLGCLLRCLGYFLFGALVGLLPAAFALAASSAKHIGWKLPIAIDLVFGLFFCLLGILTRGSFIRFILRCFGKHIDPP